MDDLRANRPALPAGFTLHATLTARDREQAVDLLLPTYWNAQVDRLRLARALDNATCSVGVRDAACHLVGHARALSDNAKYAWIYDVVVAEAHRGRGIGLAMVRALLDHAQVREASTVLLKTRDAQALYAKLGFVEVSQLPPKPYASTEMALIRR